MRAIGMVIEQQGVRAIDTAKDIAKKEILHFIIVEIKAFQQQAECESYPGSR